LQIFHGDSPAAVERSAKRHNHTVQARILAAAEGNNAIYSVLHEQEKRLTKRDFLFALFASGVFWCQAVGAALPGENVR
jgi:hypothetical protein